MPYYFISTDHFDDRDWFRDDEDFRTGMNQVAVADNDADVSILAFVLMSNHVHFVVSADNAETARKLMDRYKQLYSYYIYQKYRTPEFLRRNPIHIREVFPANESFERAVAYTLMNPVAARLCAMPGAWRWGSGNCYFNDSLPRGAPLSTLSQRKCIRLCHSKRKLNPGLTFSEDGVILPQSYISIETVEAIFRSIKRFQYFLNSSSAAKNRAEQTSSLYFRDQTIQAAVPEMKARICGEEEPQVEHWARMARELRRRFNSDHKQIARVLGIRPETAWELIQ